MKYLLAKSYDTNKYSDSPPDYALLTQHSRDVVTACGALACVVGRTTLHNAGLNTEDFEKFRLSLRTNGWIQDLGKASSHFQEMITTAPQIRQLLRHETISGILIWSEPRLQEWLLPLSDIILLSVWGAIGHHRKFDERTMAENSMALKVHISHEDFREILVDMSNDLGLPVPPRCAICRQLNRSESYRTILKIVKRILLM
jgi:CRISPR-associated endonuclease/helicase Cas3